MEQRVLFEGTLGGESIDKAIPVAISKAKDLDEDVFIRWNGATVRVNSKDTMSSVHAKYNRELANLSLINLNDSGELISKRELAKKIAKFVMNYLDTL